MSYRAAVDASSVRLKQHIIVHLHHSVYEHDNLRAGLGVFNANCERDLGISTNMMTCVRDSGVSTQTTQCRIAKEKLTSLELSPFGEEYSTAAANQINPRKPYRHIPQHGCERPQQIKPTLAKHFQTIQHQKGGNCS